MKKFYDVEEKVPLLQGIPLSLQHLFAMFGSTVLVPFLLHVNPATAFFMYGIYLSIARSPLLPECFVTISVTVKVLNSYLYYTYFFHGYSHHDIFIGFYVRKN